MQPPFAGLHDTAAAIACLEGSVTTKAARPNAARRKAAKVAADPMAHVKDAVLKTLKDTQSAVFADMTLALIVSTREENRWTRLAAP